MRLTKKRLEFCDQHHKIYKELTQYTNWLALFYWRHPTNYAKIIDDKLLHALALNMQICTTKTNDQK